jgi:hypothetical protein
MATTTAHKEQVMTTTVNMPTKIQKVIDSLNRLGITYELSTEEWCGDDTKVTIRTASDNGKRTAYAAWVIVEPRSYEARSCRRARFIGGHVMCFYVCDIIRRSSSTSAFSDLAYGARD